MSERRRQRFLEPRAEPLAYAVAAHKAVDDAVSERDRAFLSAAKAGWTVREIGAAAGISPSTAWRYVIAGESGVPVGEEARP